MSAKENHWGKSELFTVDFNVQYDEG